MRILSFVALLLAAASPALAQFHPFPRQLPPSPTGFSGRWNGVDLERRSNCAAAQNNGNRGTYAQFDVVAVNNGELHITQSGVTGLNCEYRGRTQVVAGSLTYNGTLSCSDGKQGNFEGHVVDSASTRLHLRLAIQLTGPESCTIEAILGMVRLEE